MNKLFHDGKFLFYFFASLISFVFQILSFIGLDLPFIVALPLFSLICFLTGKEIFVRGLMNLFKLNFRSISTLMSIAVAGAFYLQEFSEAAVIISLFALSEYLEAYGLRKSKSALTGLKKDMPDVARVSVTGEMKSLEEVSKGEVIKVLAGERVPLDGVIVTGSSDVDLSVITGESAPVSRSEGEEVIAGSICLNGTLEIEVTSTFEESTISRIFELAFNASKSKSVTQLFIEKFSAIYTPSIIVLALFVFLVPVLFLDKDTDLWLTQSLSLLIIACPCALVISTPLSVFSAIGTASSKGVVVKGSRVLETASEIEAVIFDKTGTLTKPVPEVADVIRLNVQNSNRILSLAAGLSLHSNHPLSKSLVKRSDEMRITPVNVNEVRHLTGKGLTGLSQEGNNLKLGVLDFVSDETVKIPDEWINNGANGSKVFLSENGVIIGAILFKEKLNTGAVEAVRDLKDAGYFTAVISGDNEKNVLREVKQFEFDGVYGSLLPVQKLSVLEVIRKKTGKVAMAGDGINDAPSIAASDLGISFGKSGTDLAAETADIVLMNEDLRLIPYLLKLGKKTSNIIKFNIGFSLSVKLIFILLAVSGLSGLFGAIMADVGLTIIVVMNSLRLMKAGC